MNKSFKNKYSPRMNTRRNHKSKEEQIIYSFNDALEITTQCINILEPYLQNKKKIYDNEYEISHEAAYNTLDYIFNYLHHSCYLLCVLPKKPIQFYKLESKSSSRYSYDAIKKNKKNLNTEICEVITKPFRLMNCIIKPLGKVSMSKEYFNLFSQARNLPLGVFICNLTDAVIMDENNDPFNIYNNKNKINKTYLPVLSTSGKYEYNDIVIPNYDDIDVIFNNTKQKSIKDFNTNWNTKINKAVFRGGATGCGLHIDTNQRLLLASMQNGREDYLDVGIVGNFETVKSNSIRIDPKYGIGILNVPEIKTVHFMSMQEQSNHKYIIHVDGNVAAYRLLTTMLTGSLILRVSSDYTLWCDNFMIANKHYIPIKRDLSDLDKVIKWCISNDLECKKIAGNALTLARKILTKQFIYNNLNTLMLNAGGI